MEIEHKYWYVLHAPDTKIQDLVRKIKTVLGDENVLFPIAIDRKLNRRRNLFVEKEFPLFYNYIFVKLGECDRGVEEFLQSSVNSHIKILCRSGEEKWAPLSNEEISKIKNTIMEVKQDSMTFKCDYDIGDRVKILLGPFKFFNGVVADFNKNKRTVSVNVFIFGRETSVDTDMEAVEKVE